MARDPAWTLAEQKREREANMKKRPEPSPLKKQLRYVLRVVVDLDPSDAGDITDLIDRNRELGTCTIEDVSVVEVTE